MHPSRGLQSSKQPPPLPLGEGWSEGSVPLSASSPSTLTLHQRGGRDFAILLVRPLRTLQVLFFAYFPLALARLLVKAKKCLHIYNGGHSTKRPKRVFYQVMERKRPVLEKPKINMTPMIDVVFLLLTFFVLTFKIIVPEGDFNIQMSSMGQAQPVETDADSVQVRLYANEDGRLSEIHLNDQKIESFDSLRQSVLALALTNPDVEVVLHPDEHLHYEYVVKAITAINGEVRGEQIVKIVDNIKFARENQKRSR